MSKAYVDALEMVRHAGHGGLLERKKLGNNTWAVRSDDAVSVRLHSTDIVTFRSDGRVVLDSGGWRTVTTKERMNRFVPGVRVFSDRGRWFVSPVGRFDSVAVPFYDGLEIDADAREIIVDPEKVDGEAEADAAEKLLKRRVKKFVELMEEPDRAAGFLGQVLDGELWTGDCWYCLMRTDDGRTLGDASGDPDHLMQHLDDEYLVPSLFRNAFGERYGDLGDRRLMVYAMDVRSGRARSNRAEVSRVMVKYFVKRLIKRGE
jgi:hypothetical protein